MPYTPGSSGSSGNWNNDAHGSARWMTAGEADEVELYTYDPDGRGSIVLGQNSKGAPCFLNRQGHVLVLAPPRSGKGIGFVQSNLVGYGGSMVVTDPKGENAAVSAWHRRENCKQNIVILDPTQKLASYGIEDAPNHCFNPLTAFDNANYEQVVDDIALVADALLVVKDDKGEQYWRNGARWFLIALLTYLTFFVGAEDRHLIKLARMANGLEMPLDDIFLALTHNGHPDPAMRDVIARAGSWWDKVNVKERASFVSVALQSLSWLASPVWQNHLTRSDFHPYDLKSQDRKTTVYIVCPFEKLEQYSPWFRLVLSCCIVAVLRAPRRCETPVLFMLDEYAATIGRLAALEQSIPFIEGVGGRFAMIFQYLSQMQKLWPEPEYHGIFASAGAHIFFNVNDQNTAQYVSDYMGKYGAMTPTPGGMSFVQREVLTPDEVRTLPPNDQIAFIRNYRPAWLGKINVREHREFKTFLADNPAHWVLPETGASGALSGGGNMPLLDHNAAIAQAKGAREASLSRQSMAARIEEKYPGKTFRFEKDLFGYDELWLNPATGVQEEIFVPVVHADFLKSLPAN